MLDKRLDLTYIVSEENKQMTKELERERVQNAKRCDWADMAQRHSGRELDDAIKGYVEYYCIPDLGASMASDLLNGAIGQVNWKEVSEHYRG